MARWARVLGRHHWNDTGVVVVFVNAAVPNEGGVADTRDEHAKQAAVLRRAYDRVLSIEGMSGPEGRAVNRQVELARAQIHLASWMDWFPAAGSVNSSFAGFPTVFAATEGAWRREPLADPAGFWDFNPSPALAERVDAPRRTRRDVYACPKFLTVGDDAAAA